MAAWTSIVLAALLGTARPEDLLGKVLRGGSRESVGVSSALCCGNFLRVNADYEPGALADYSLDGEDGGCMVAGNHSLPYVWVPPEVDPYLFLLIDFKTPHTISEVRQYRVAEFRHWPAAAALCQFSSDGFEWAPPVACGCRFSANERARMVRLFVTSAPANMAAVAFVPHGEKITDYPPVTRIKSAQPCPGFQARVDVEIMSPAVSARWCDDIAVTISRDGTPLWPPGAPGHRSIDHAIQVALQQLPEYEKCSISMMIEAFQSSYNGQYRFVATPTSGTPISESIELAVVETGEEEDLFFITVEEGDFYIMTAPLSAVTREAMVEACFAHRRGAVVLSPSQVEAFQVSGSNRFLQTFILFHQDAGIGEDVGAAKYGVLQDMMDVFCVSVDAPTGALVTSSCGPGDAVDDVICLLEQGEVTDLRITPASCQVPPADPTRVDLSFTVSGTVIGAGIQREVVCRALDWSLAPIPGTKQTLTISKAVSDTYSVSLHVSRQASAVECFLDRKMNTNVVTTSVTHPFPTSQSPVLIRHASRNAIYLQLEDYDRPYQVVMETSGYPMNEFYYMYTMWSFDDSQDPRPGLPMDTSREFRCLEDLSITVDAVGTKEFRPQLTPGDSGRYQFHIGEAVTGETELERWEWVELVHPFRIACSNSCVGDVAIGAEYAATCTVDHHLLTAAQFKPHEWPFTVHLFKQHHSPLNVDGQLQQVAHMNPCEYSVPLEHHPIPISDVDLARRRLSFKVRLFSTQPWNLGEYLLLVKLRDPAAHCYYQSPARTYLQLEQVPELSRCGGQQLSHVHNYLQLSLHSTQDPGAFFPGDEAMCAGNSRAVYVTHPEQPNGSFFYKLCFLSPGVELPPQSVCLAEGGELVSTMLDGVGDAMAAHTLSSPDRIPYLGYSVNRLLDALVCNGFSRYGEGDSTENGVYLQTGEYGSGRIQAYKYIQGRLLPVSGVPQGAAAGVLCRYRPALIWDMYGTDTSDCLYRKIDMSHGQTQNVRLKLHGNGAVTAVCEAVDPPGAKPPVTYRDLVVQSGIQFTVDYPTEPAVLDFKCYQKYDDRHPWVAEVPFGKAYHFRFKSLPLTLQVEERVEVRSERHPLAPPTTPTEHPPPEEPPLDPVWCYPEGAALSQPCYGRRAQMRCCAQGNPLLDCRWRRLENPLPLENDSYVSTEFTQPDPQCNSTRSCSTLTFSELRPQHHGYYACVCTNGLEHSLPQMVVRPQTQYYPIIPHQTAPMGDRQFRYYVESRPPRLFARAVLFGQSVDGARVECDDGEGWSERDTSNQLVLPGVTVIEVNITDTATTDTRCRYNGSNRFAELPLVFATPIAERTVLHEMTATNVSARRFCCQLSAFGVTPRTFSASCTAGGGGPPGALPLWDETYEYERSRFLGQRCATIEDTSFTVDCSCRFREYRANFTFFANGNTEEEPLGPFWAPENVTNIPYLTTQSAAASTPLPEDGAGDGSTAAADFGPTVVYNVQEMNIAQGLSEIEYLVEKQKGAVIGLEMARSARLIADNLEALPLSLGRSFHILHALHLMQRKQYTTNETVPTAEKSLEMVGELCRAAAEIVQGLLLNTQQLRTDEHQSLNFTSALVQTLHHFGRHLLPAQRLHLSTNHNAAFLQLSQLSAAATTQSAVAAGHAIDHTGLNRHTKQTVNVSEESLATLPTGTTLLILIVDGSLIPVEKTRQSSSDFSSRVEEFGAERVADVALVSARAPAAGEDLGSRLKLEYSLNLYTQLSPPPSAQGSAFVTELELECVYYDSFHRSYFTTGVTSLLMEPTRAACAASHATPFSVRAHVHMRKHEPREKEEHYWVTWASFAAASAVLTVLFALLVYISDETGAGVDETHCWMRYCLLTYLQVLLCAYLGGVDRVGVRAWCGAAQWTMHAAMLGSLGSLNNMILLILREVTPSAYLSSPAHAWGVLYALNILPIPAVAATAGLVGSLGELGHGYSCFLPATHLSTALTLYLPLGVYTVATLGLVRLSHRRADHIICEWTDEASVPDELTILINNVALIAPALAGVLVLGTVTMSVESLLLHAAFGAAMLALAALLFFTMFLRSLDVREAWLQKKKITLPELRKKRKRRSVPGGASQMYRETCEPAATGDAVTREDSSRASSALSIFDFPDDHEIHTMGDGAAGLLGDETCWVPPETRDGGGEWPRVQADRHGKAGDKKQLTAIEEMESVEDERLEFQLLKDETWVPAADEERNAVREDTWLREPEVDFDCGAHPARGLASEEAATVAQLDPIIPPHNLKKKHKKKKKVIDAPPVAAMEVGAPGPVQSGKPPPPPPGKLHRAARARAGQIQLAADHLGLEPGKREEELEEDGSTEAGEASAAVGDDSGRAMSLYTQEQDDME